MPCFIKSWIDIPNSGIFIILNLSKLLFILLESNGTFVDLSFKSDKISPHTFSMFFISSPVKGAGSQIVTLSNNKYFLISEPKLDNFFLISIT